jgi:adenylate kinase
MSTKKQALVFIGPPGSGKGSLSKLCVQHYQWAQLSTGNLCRHHIAHQTEIGKEIAFAIKSGNLISDSLITSMVKEWLSEKIENVQTVILDGYPRAVAQARAFHETLKAQFPQVELKVVCFTIPDEVIVGRLSGRLICKNSECQAVYSTIEGSSLQPKQSMVCDACSTPLGQRDDDQLTAVRERLAIYHRHERDLVNFYREIGQPVIEINAERPLQHVFEDFKHVVGLTAA